MSDQQYVASSTARQQERLEAGLRILARMIAAAYRRRYAATGGKKEEAAGEGGGLKTKKR